MSKSFLRGIKEIDIDNLDEICEYIHKVLAEDPSKKNRTLKGATTKSELTWNEQKQLTNQYRIQMAEETFLDDKILTYSDRYKLILLTNFFNALAHIFKDKAQRSKDKSKADNALKVSEKYYELKCEIIKKIIDAFGKENIMFQLNNKGIYTMYLPISFDGQVELMAWHVPSNIIEEHIGKPQITSNEDLRDSIGMSYSIYENIKGKPRAEGLPLNNYLVCANWDYIRGTRDGLDEYPIESPQSIKLENEASLTSEQQKILDVFSKINLDADLEDLAQAIKFLDYSILEGYLGKGDFENCLLLNNGPKEAENKHISVFALALVISKLIDMPGVGSNALKNFYNKLVNKLQGIGTKFVTPQGDSLIVNFEQHNSNNSYKVEYVGKGEDSFARTTAAIPLYNKTFCAAEDIKFYKANDSKTVPGSKYKLLSKKIPNQLINHFNTAKVRNKEIVEEIQKIDVENLDKFEFSLLKGILPSETIDLCNELKLNNIPQVILLLSSFINETIQNFEFTSKEKEIIKGVYNSLVDKIKNEGRVIKPTGKGNKSPQLLIDIGDRKFVKLTLYSYDGENVTKEDVTGISFTQLVKALIDKDISQWPLQGEKEEVEFKHQEKDVELEKQPTATLETIKIDDEKKKAQKDLKNILCGKLKSFIGKNTNKLSEQIKTCNFTKIENVLNEEILSTLSMAQNGAFADDMLRVVVLTSAIAKILEDEQLRSDSLQELYQMLLERISKESGKKCDDKFIVFVNDGARVVEPKDENSYYIEMPLYGAIFDGVECISQLEGKDFNEISDVESFITGTSKIKDTFKSGGAYGVSQEEKDEQVPAVDTELPTVDECNENDKTQYITAEDVQKYVSSNMENIIPLIKGMTTEQKVMITRVIISTSSPEELGKIFKELFGGGNIGESGGIGESGNRNGGFDHE